MTTTRRSILIAALTAAVLIVSACGGTTTTTTSAPATTVTQPPVATPAPTVVPVDPSPSDAIAIPSFDISDLVKNLEGFDSYRVTITTNGDVQYRAVVVTKPVLSRDATLQDGTRIVAIGDEAWMGTGDDLQSVPATMTAGLLSAFDPVLLAGAFASPGAMTGAEDLGTEEKNGIASRHYRIDSASVVGSLASMPPGSSIDVWIAEAGYLTSLAVNGFDASGGSFTMDVTNVNDPANKVERPG
ncbi:hypothetical protein BH20CHL7_BH20CHL7_02910 [soil metagenome]